MRDAESLLDGHAPSARPRTVAAPPPPAVSLAMPMAGQSRLLLALESTLEPLVTVLSLWLVVWLFEGGLTPAWLIVSARLSSTLRRRGTNTRPSRM